MTHNSVTSLRLFFIRVMIVVQRRWMSIMKELNVNVLEYALEDEKELYVTSVFSADDTEQFAFEQEQLIRSFELGVLFE